MNPFQQSFPIVRFRVGRSEVNTEHLPDADAEDMKEAGRRHAENPARGTEEMKMMQGYSAMSLKKCTVKF
jgi:hypothetical protein